LLDAPSRENPEYRQFLHWLIVNIPMQIAESSDHICLCDVDVLKGKILTEYMGPAPPKDTGKHRYGQ